MRLWTSSARRRTSTDDRLCKDLPVCFGECIFPFASRALGRKRRHPPKELLKPRARVQNQNHSPESSSNFPFTHLLAHVSSRMLACMHWSRIYLAVFKLLFSSCYCRSSKNTAGLIKVVYRQSMITRARTGCSCGRFQQDIRVLYFFFFIYLSLMPILILAGGRWPTGTANGIRRWKQTSSRRLPGRGVVVFF